MLHTVNPRLFPEQIQYIVDHAENGYVFFDVGFAPNLEKLAAHLPSVRGYVALCNADEMPTSDLPSLLCYETLLAAESDVFAWPERPESAACSLCYTSGTTGNPKGVPFAAAQYGAKLERVALGAICNPLPKHRDHLTAV